MFATLVSLAADVVDVTGLYFKAVLSWKRLSHSLHAHVPVGDGVRDFPGVTELCLVLLSWRPLSDSGTTVAVEALLKADVSTVSRVWPVGESMDRASWSRSSPWAMNLCRPHTSSTSDCDAKRYVAYETGGDDADETDSPLDMDAVPSRESGDSGGGLFPSLVEAEERFHVLAHWWGVGKYVKLGPTSQGMLSGISSKVGVFGSRFDVFDSNSIAESTGSGPIC